VSACRRAVSIAFLLPVLLALLSTACSAPPDKEINQAEGAIEAARAAGADAYAAAEFGAAVAALEKARDAVGQRDYRLALSHALDARERAQEAAKQGAAQRAVVHGEVEAHLARIATLRQTVAARLAVARTGRLTSGELAAIDGRLDAVDREVQEARAALSRGDAFGARSRLEPVDGQLQESLTAIDAALSAQQAKRRR
jgi:hypothetical protein